jgi:hypothetical protein
VSISCRARNLRCHRRCVFDLIEFTQVRLKQERA